MQIVKSLAIFFRDSIKDLLVLAYHLPHFEAGFSQFLEGRTCVRDMPRAGRRTEAVTPTMVANIEAFVSKDRRVTM